jgi:excisionase family DNA binding protein
MPVLTTKAKIRKKRFDTNRPTIEPLKIYTPEEIARMGDCSLATIMRAIGSKHLKSYKIGRNRKVSGQQFLDWLEAGGKTGHTCKVA